ncbi:hypothetical protein JW964_15790 [candidate division KSB1 bacterium]|nr:hypothetical protein [candidate division KSB1 bacterium]
MAQMPRFQDSTEKLLDISRRHERLCSLVPDGEKLATAIHEKFVDLEAKHQNALKCRQLRENVLDDANLCELHLENSIRTLFERCKQFDRDNPNASILYKIFPEGKFSPYIDKQHEAILDKSIKLLQRLESLGTEHAIYEQAGQLQEKIGKARLALQKFSEILQTEKQALTAEQMAKDALREQYHINYYEARKLFRKNYADRLFPDIRKQRRARSAHDANNSPDSTTPQSTT